LKNLLTYSLILVLATPLLYRGLVLIDYAFRFDFYTTVLCENQSKPELNCNGTCQLAKATQLENDGNNNEVPEVFKFEISPFKLNQNRFTLSITKAITKKRNTPPYINLYQFLNIKNWVEPPAQV
jgi:hypothetical protein